MAAGDLITADWEVELQGLLMGGTSPFIIRRFKPWSAPTVDAGDRGRGGRGGLVAGRDLPRGRNVPLELYIDAGTESADLAARTDLAAAWGLVDVDVPLVWQEDGIKWRLNGRPRLADSDLAARVPTECRFVATDPTIYTNVESSAATTFPAGGAGRTYPRTYPRVYGSPGTGGLVSAVNTGTAAVPWRAEITGPWVNPTILQVATGRQLTINVTLDAGEVLTVSSKPRSIVLGGTASRYSSLVQPASWFDLQPGSNEIRFGGASGSGSALLAWRSGLQ